MEHVKLNEVVRFSTAPLSESLLEKRFDQRCCKTKCSRYLNFLHLFA